MTLIRNLELDRLTPSRLWAELDTDTRRLAAGALYNRDWDDEASKAEANAAIASALRFRIAAVRRLPGPKRIDYLCKAVRPDDSLAGALLRALHLNRRKEMLGAFLDGLGIPQEDGVIDADHDVGELSRERLREAVEGLRGNYPDPEIELYLVTLLALEPEVWGELGGILDRTAG